jgi:tetratricopeptide (TPR) repeat protein
LAEAFSWLGEHDRAIATSRQAVDVAGSGAVEELVNTLVAGERYEEAELQLTKIVAVGPSAPLWALNGLARTLRLQGRSREALSVADRIGSLQPPVSGVRESKLLQLEMGTRRLGIARDTCASAKEDLDWAVLCAPALAYQGALAEAEPMAGLLRPKSPALRLHHALALWRGGRSADALIEFRALDRDHPVPFPFGLVVPSFFIAELAFESGLSEEALAAARRFQGLRVDGLWRGWAYPRSFVLSARAAERLGRRDEALADVRHLLKMLGRADADDADLVAARELERRLTVAPQ